MRPEEYAFISGVHVLEDKLIDVDLSMSVDLDDNEDFCFVDITWKTTSTQGRELTEEERHRIKKLSDINDVLRTLRNTGGSQPIQLVVRAFIISTGNYGLLLFPCHYYELRYPEHHWNRYPVFVSHQKH